MSSLKRPLDGQMQVHHLNADRQMIDQALLEKHGRSARTLSKDGPFRVTIFALAAGGEMPPHKAEGPVSIHVLDGDVAFTCGDNTQALSGGDLVVLEGNVEHALKSTNGCTVLLTVVHGVRSQ